MLPKFLKQTVRPEGWKLKPVQAVSMTALHSAPENTHLLYPGPRRVSEASRPEATETRFQRGSSPKQSANTFIFNGLSNGLLRPECFFLLTMLLPIHLWKQAGRQIPQKRLARGGWRAGSRLTGPRLSVCTQYSDHTARAEMACNVSNRSTARSAGCRLAEPRGRGSHALSGLD